MINERGDGVKCRSKIEILYLRNIWKYIETLRENELQGSIEEENRRNGEKQGRNEGRNEPREGERSQIQPREAKRPYFPLGTAVFGQNTVVPRGGTAVWPPLWP